MFTLSPIWKFVDVLLWFKMFIYYITGISETHSLLVNTIHVDCTWFCTPIKLNICCHTKISKPRIKVMDRKLSLSYNCSASDDLSLQNHKIACGLYYGSCGLYYGSFVLYCKAVWFYTNGKVFYKKIQIKA